MAMKEPSSQRCVLSQDPERPHPQCWRSPWFWMSQEVRSCLKQPRTASQRGRAKSRWQQRDVGVAAPSEPTQGGPARSRRRCAVLLPAAQTKLPLLTAKRVKQREARERKDSVGKPVKVEHDRRHKRLRDPADRPSAAQDERSSHAEGFDSSVNLRAPWIALR
jgi:hypothetical protein